jgi:hypothetical protein
MKSLTYIHVLFYKSRSGFNMYVRNKMSIERESQQPASM